jgi:hypothetical protein
MMVMKAKLTWKKSVKYYHCQFLKLTILLTQIKKPIPIPVLKTTPLIRKQDSILLHTNKFHFSHFGSEMLLKVSHKREMKVQTAPEKSSDILTYLVKFS